MSKFSELFDFDISVSESEIEIPWDQNWDQFGFDYEFISSTEQYQSGAFDETLKLVLARNQQILDIMLPTLGKERQATYSPILPISPILPMRPRYLPSGCLVTALKMPTVVWKPRWPPSIRA